MNRFFGYAMWLTFCYGLGTLTNKAVCARYVCKEREFDEEFEAIKERCRNATTKEEQIKASGELYELVHKYLA